MRRAMLVAKNELTILSGDWGAHIVLIGMPVVLMIMVSPVFRAALRNEGYTGVSGGEQAAPGMAVMFAFFLVGNVGLAFFREHGWRTWDRLRASPARPVELVAGKLSPLLVMVLAQQAIIFVVAALVIGLSVRGSVLGFVAVVAAFSTMVLTMGLAVVALCRSVQQVTAMQTVGTLLFAGIGGALTPITLMPGWVRAIAPASPAYWAMKGYRASLLEHGATGEQWEAFAVLLAWSAAFLAIGLRRFSAEDQKLGYAPGGG